MVHETNPPPADKNADAETELQDSKMELRLARAKSLTGSLPEKLKTHLMKWAEDLLKSVITEMHFEKRRTFMVTNPSFLPKSIRFKFELKTKTELQLEGTEKFEALREAANVVMAEAKTRLRDIIRSTQDLEELSIKGKTREDFKKGLKLSN